LAGSATAAIVKEGISYVRRKAEVKINMADNAKDIADVHRIMESIVRETHFDRFLILVGEDSSGVLAAGKNLYVTAQYEKISSENEALKSIQNDIQRWKSDTPYYEMFSEMIAKGKVSIKTKSTTAIVLNIIEGNPTTVNILGSLVSLGVTETFANVTGLTLEVCVQGN